MADSKTLKHAFKRNKQALKKRPSLGQNTALTTVRVRNGTTCEIESGSKRLVCDVGTKMGGNDAGPGPSILQRGALGSCLAIGYATWAAEMEIPVEDIKVEVESDYDARGQFGVTEEPPGFMEIRYCVSIESPASEDRIRELIETADAHSPVLDDFKRPIPVNREIKITSTGGEMS